MTSINLLTSHGFLYVYFRDLLRLSTSSLTTHPLVYMRALPYEILASVIDFIYHGVVDVEKEDLETFLRVGSVQFSVFIAQSRRWLVS